MRLRRCENSSQWDALVDSFDESLLFHSWAWLDLQERVLGVVFERHVLERSGEPVGVFPIARHTARSLSSPGLPYPFQGPLAPADVAHEVAPALRGRQRRGGLLLERFDVGPLLAHNWRAALEQSGCVVNPFETVVVDLGGHETGEGLLSTYSRNHRRSISRAKAAGCVIRPAHPGEVAASLWPLLTEAYGSHGDECPYPVHVGPLLEEWAGGRDDVGLLAAEVQGELAGLLVVLGGRPTALAWVGGCFRRFRNLSANALLHHEMLVWALRRGHRRLDFLGGVGDAGVRRFKLGFGGELLAGLRVESSLVPQRPLAAVRKILRSP